MCRTFYLPLMTSTPPLGSSFKLHGFMQKSAVWILNDFRNNVGFFKIINVSLSLMKIFFNQ